MNFDIATERLDGGVFVIALSGEVDLYTAPEFKQQLIDAVTDGARHVIVDLTETTFIDSTTLGVLVGGVRRLREKEGDLSLVCSDRNVTKIFEITGLNQVFSIAPSRDEALARLAELVSGEGPFDIADTDEFLEGSVPGLDRRVVTALKRGEYAVQAHVDLHGLSKAEAKEEVDRFLAASRRDGKRCVLVVHGRGLNSKDHIPVLKEQLKVWLQRGRIGRSVLAFATARPHDGGGAIGLREPVQE